MYEITYHAHNKSKKKSGLADLNSVQLNDDSD